MDRTELRAAFAAAAKVTRDAGRLALSYFERRGGLSVEQKGPQDFVTQADRDVEGFIIERLHLIHPRAGVLAEESAPRYAHEDKPVWVIDPIDGTGNFIRGIPLFCISVALWEAGEVRFGLIFDPVRDEMFEAIEGEGAFMEGRALHGSTTREPSRAVIGLGRSLRTSRGQVAAAFQHVVEADLAVRMIGSAALAAAWVASGRLDAFFESRLGAWDVAAAIRITREAGCICEARLGPDEMREGTAFLVSNAALYPLVRHLRVLASNEI